MQRFLIFILIVVLTCIVVTRIFMNGLDPVGFIAATDAVQLSIEPPFYNNPQLLMDLSWNQAQLVYLYKIMMLGVIVLVAVLNYKAFLSDQEESTDNN